MVRDSEEFKVIDYTTKNDITRQILISAILEKEKKATTSLEVEDLKGIIVGGSFPSAGRKAERIQ
jgi:polyhydroxyalkanoate synthesis regulator protein